MRLISEEVRIDTAFAPTDLNAGTQTGTWLEMKNYRRVLAYVTTAAVAAGKDVTVQLMQAKDSTGTGSKALSSLVTVTNSGAAAAVQTGTVEAYVSDLDLPNGYEYVTAQVTTNNGATLEGTAVLIRGDSRFGTDVA